MCTPGVCLSPCRLRREKEREREREREGIPCVVASMLPRVRVKGQNASHASVHSFLLLHIARPFPSLPVISFLFNWPVFFLFLFPPPPPPPPPPPRLSERKTQRGVLRLFRHSPTGGLSSATCALASPSFFPLYPPRSFPHPAPFDPQAS